MSESDVHVLYAFVRRDLDKLILVYIGVYLRFTSLSCAIVGSYQGIHISLALPPVEILLNSLAISKAQYKVLKTLQFFCIISCSQMVYW